MYSKWQIGNQIFYKVLDIKRRARIYAGEMVSKLSGKLFNNAVCVPFSHFLLPIIFYSMQSNLSAEKEYFSMQVLNKSEYYIVQRQICRLSKFWKPPNACIF